MKFRTTTLGCKVNQFETAALEHMLEGRGFVAAKADETADVIIINTCAVTAESGRKSRQAIRKLMAENPYAVTAVCGCYSQLESKKIEELGAQIVHGSGDKKHFLEDIDRAIRDKQVLKFHDDPFSRSVFEELSGGAVEGRTRAMLKIQDGCANFCTYCIIPYTRGRVRSLPPERCAEQTRILAEKGFSELVVTGIEIASYGKDLKPKCSLIDAITAIASAAGDMRLRLGSLEPTVITEEFCQRIKENGVVCDHFHLSLQSGCDEVLKAMNRKYDTEMFFKATELLRKHFPDCGLTADLIVGFPAETEEMHQKTLQFIEKCAFSSLHIFPYSVRPGTKAAEMQGQHTRAEKAKRASEAQAIAEKTALGFLDSCIGKILPVIFEINKDGMSIGHASNYAQVSVNDGKNHGIVQNVKITDILGEMLVGIVV